MFELTDLLLFTSAGLMLNFTPGPDMIYCATRSVGQGRAAGVVSALGIGAGSMIHMTAAAAGLSALLMYSSLAFEIVRYAGAAYLIYLGIRTIMSGKKINLAARTEKAPLKRVFWQGVFTNVLNPKVALFYLSFLPQFVDPTHGSVALQILILGMIFNTTGTIVNSIVGMLFGQVGGWLDRRPGFWKAQRWTTGGILVGLGASLALTSRK